MKPLKARHLPSGPAHISGPSKRQRVDDGGYAAFEFGRSRVLLRQRQLLVDGVPVELGARAFDLLLALLEADGALVTKDELLDQVWPGIVVSEENLKVQVSRLRKALGGDGGLIRTEFGRGYRFTGVLHSKVSHCPIRAYCGPAELCFYRIGGNRSGGVSVRASDRRGRPGNRYRPLRLWPL